MNRGPGTPAHAAESRAAEIFGAIGVRLQWHDGPCPTSPGAIKIEFADEAADGISFGALAYAYPYEGSHIVVLYGRVRRQCCVDQLLAYVLAHEITHILEGDTRHSATGIMKAHWNRADYYYMVSKTLAFTPEDVESIYRGIDSREARMASNGRPQVAAQ